MKLLLILVAIFFSTFLVTTNEVYSQEIGLPDWIKNTAQWWSEGKVSDNDFVSGIQYLLDNNILEIASTNVDDDYITEYKSWAKNEIQKLKEYSGKLKSENRELADYKRNAFNKINALTIENHALKQENERLVNLYENALDAHEERYTELYEYAEDYEQEVQDWYDELDAKPRTVIENQEINWHMIDSKGNKYHWSMPVSGYEEYVIADRFHDELYLESTTSGDTFSVMDHTKYVRTSFVDVIDELYENSDDDADFIYEVWFITSQLTTYSEDIGEYPRYALETLSRGGGDCEDTTILILDMLKSSSYTKNWEFQMVYFDADELKYPTTINHVAPYIITPHGSYIVESTAKTIEGMDQYNSESLVGWYFDV